MQILNIKKVVLFFLSIFIASIAVAQEKQWYPSVYGANDEIGAANLLSPEIVLKATKLIKKGKTVNLGVEISTASPAFGHRIFHLQIAQPYQAGGSTFGPNKFSFVDEYLSTWTGIGTQINGVGHVGINNVYYNGNKAKDFVKPTGVTRLGLEKVPPIVTRAVLVDMTDYFKKEIVPAGTVFTVANIKEQLKKQKIKIEKGNIVLFYTGWIHHYITNNKKFVSGEPGIGMEAAKWLADQNIVAWGSDSESSEAVPGKTKAFRPVNQYLLAKRGLYNFEMVDTRPLVKEKVYEFLFVNGHTRIKGTTQLMVNPIAIY